MVIIRLMCNVHPYFSLKNLGKEPAGFLSQERNKNYSVDIGLLTCSIIGRHSFFFLYFSFKFEITTLNYSFKTTEDTGQVFNANSGEKSIEERKVFTNKVTKSPTSCFTWNQIPTYYWL